MSFNEITKSDLNNKGVVGLPDTPGLSTSDMQKKFDEIATDVIIPRFNELVKELNKLGVKCEESEENKGICIYPSKVLSGFVETYDDHRMAMAFTLIGLRIGEVIIKNYKLI